MEKEKKPGWLDIVQRNIKNRNIKEHYLLGRAKAINMINSLRVGPCHIGADHSYL